MTHSNALSLCAVVAATAGTFALASPASSRTAPILVVAPADQVTRHVTYADLNLASAAGEKTLNRRVDVAVGDLCLDATGGNDGSFTYKTSMMRCSQSAWHQATPQIDRAVQRAREIAFTGSSSIAASTLTISLPR
jgi:UrcA family protein